MWELEVLAILKGGTKSVHPLRKGEGQVLPCLEGGRAQNVSDPHFPNFKPPFSLHILITSPLENNIFDLPWPA